MGSPKQLVLCAPLPGLCPIISLMLTECEKFLCILSCQKSISIDWTAFSFLASIIISLIAITLFSCVTVVRFDDFDCKIYRFKLFWPILHVNCRIVQLDLGIILIDDVTSKMYTFTMSLRGRRFVSSTLCTFLAMLSPKTFFLHIFLGVYLENRVTGVYSKEGRLKLFLTFNVFLSCVMLYLSQNISLKCNFIFRFSLYCDPCTHWLEWLNCSEKRIPALGLWLVFS